MDEFQIFQIALMALGILSLILGAFCTIYGGYKAFNGVDSPKGMIYGTLLLGIAFLFIFGAREYLPKLKEEEQKEKQHYEQAMENYTWYLDGKQVDPKTISIDSYQKEYNDSDKIVVLTKSSVSTSTIILIICFAIMIFSFMSRMDRT